MEILSAADLNILFHRFPLQEKEARDRQQHFINAPELEEMMG